MKPSLVLRLYCALSFAVGILFTVPIALMVNRGELDANAGASLVLCWNVLFLMILPLILDWSERKYFKARFMELEELAATNPELKTIIDEQCQKLSLAGLRFAIVESASSEAFTYGLWRQNPRLIVPTSWLSSSEKEKLVPSIEVELTRFAKHDVTVVYILFAVLQVLLQMLIVQLV